MQSYFLPRSTATFDHNAVCSSSFLTKIQYLNIQGFFKQRVVSLWTRIAWWQLFKVIQSSIPTTLVLVFLILFTNSKALVFRMVRKEAKIILHLISDLMKLKKMNASTKAGKSPSKSENSKKGDALISRYVSAMCFDFHPNDGNL